MLTVGCLVGWCDWLVGSLVVCLVGFEVGGLVGWLVVYLVAKLTWL